MKKKILSHILCAALVVICSALMPLLLYFQNIGAVNFYEIAIFIGIYSFIGLLVFTVLRFVFKSEYKAGVAAAFFSLIFQNAGRLTEIIPYQFVLIIFVLVIGALIFAVWKFLKDEIAKLFVTVLSLVLAILILFNTIISIGTFSSVAKANSEIGDDINSRYEYLISFKEQTKTSEELPNFYFILVDEYAGFSSLNKHYDYDNNEFKEFLIGNGFTVSENSTNYLDGTFECVANMLNLEFSEKNNYKNTSENYCQKKGQDGALLKLAEDEGYNITVAQTTPLTKYESETAIYGDKWSSTGNGKSTIDLMVSPSVLVPFTDKLRSVLNGVSLDYFQGSAHIRAQAQSFIDPLLYYADSNNVGKENSFNFCYTSIPHQPFFFDENGNLIEGTAHLNDWGNKEYYLNQLKYCNTLLKDTISNITENDPDSVIILMSDHGARNHSEESSANAWMNKMSAKDNTDILCAVYYKGEKFDNIDGMCGSNVLISLVNEAWGYNIPLIEQSDSYYYK